MKKLFLFVAFSVFFAVLNVLSLWYRGRTDHTRHHRHHHTRQTKKIADALINIGVSALSGAITPLISTAISSFINKLL